jgi:hypothetical protein
MEEEASDGTSFTSKWDDQDFVDYIALISTIQRRIQEKTDKSNC